MGIIGAGTTVGKHGILGRMDIASDNNLFSVMGQDKVGESITLGGNANPATKTFRFVRVFKEYFLPEVEGQEGRNIGDFSHHNSVGNSTFGIDKNIQQTDDEQHAKQPEFGRAANMIHGAGGEVLDILDVALNRVLVLIMRFRLGILDEVKAVNVLHGKAGFRLGIVTHQSLWSTMVVDEILKSVGHI